MSNVLESAPRIADPRVEAMLDLAHELLADSAAHVAACCRIDEQATR